MQRLQREHFVEDHAQRIDIGSRVDLFGFAARLFRRHVAGGAEHCAVDRVGFACSRRFDDLVVIRTRFFGCGRTRDFGQPPVQHVNLAVISEHDIGRFEVAMQHSPGMREVDRQTSMAKSSQQFAPRIFFDVFALSRDLTVDDLFQGASPHAFHREVDVAVGRPAEIIDGNHRWVFELSLNSRLAHETSQCVGLGNVAPF